MFNVSTSWFNGLGQVLVYSGVLLIILWVMSKIEIKGGGESPTKREGEGK